MLAFHVIETKEFMAKLLKGEDFDTFALRQFDAETFVKFEILGQRNQDFYENNPENPERSEKELDKYCSWAEIRPYAFLLIKGKRLPKSIKIVFSLNEKHMTEFPNAAALFLNISFFEGVISCTTGCSQKIFALDKVLEQLWDEYIMDYFEKCNISIEES